MRTLLISWLYVIVTVAVGVTANTISTKWAHQPNLLHTPWLLPMLLISPFVFVTFGLTASRMGLAIGSANVDALLTVVTILVGLIALREWKTVSAVQYIGIAVVVVGIILTQFGKAQAPV